MERRWRLSNCSRFITTGLASLIDEQIIGSAPHIPVLNAAGCNLLQLNVLVLQHNLKNIEPQVQLLRSTLYFDLYAGGPNNVIAHAKTKSKSVGFSFEQMKVLLQLCYSEALKSDQQDVSAAAEKGLEEHMQQLSQAMGLDFR
jgi:exocyst complex component 4